MRLVFQKAFIVLFGLAISLGSSASSYLKIGNQTIILKDPSGFLETSKKSSELWDLAKLMVSGKNEVIAHYVSKEDLDDYYLNKNPEFEQYFIILTPKATKKSYISQEDFKKFRFEIISTQNELRKNIEPRVNRILNNLSDDLSIQLKKEISMNINQMKPVSININLPNFLSYSVFSKINVSDHKTDKNHIIIGTTGIILIKGKLLIINSYRNFKSPQDLQDSRASIENWVN